MSLRNHKLCIVYAICIVYASTSKALTALISFFFSVTQSLKFLFSAHVSLRNQQLCIAYTCASKAHSALFCFASVTKEPTARRISVPVPQKHIQLCVTLPVSLKNQQLCITYACASKARTALCNPVLVPPGDRCSLARPLLVRWITVIYKYQLVRSGSLPGKR